LRQAFTPEFRNRIDGIISFSPLPEKVMIRIVEKFLNELSKKLKTRHVSLEISEDAKHYLARKGFDPAYGARPLKRCIEDNIKKPLSEELLFGQLSRGGTARVGYEKSGEILTFSYISSHKKQKA